MQTYQFLLQWTQIVLPLIAVGELLYLHATRRRYSLPEALASAIVSLVQRLAVGAGLGIFAALYDFLWRHRLFTIDLQTVWGLPLLFLTQDFLYYWQHRLSHECRWFWASHVTHHTPNYLNLSAAYRLSWTAPFTGQTLIFLPLAWLGFHPAAIFAMIAINLLYQFWLHTELVPGLGMFDTIFNSPSNHRVHHAANLRYLDANYGGILIIFDRIFGTWIPETEPCRYGLVQPQTSHNPLTLVFAEWRALWLDVRSAPNWACRLQFLLRAPGWRPGGAGRTTADLRRMAGGDNTRRVSANAQPIRHS